MKAENVSLLLMAIGFIGGFIWGYVFAREY